MNEKLKYFLIGISVATALYVILVFAVVIIDAKHASDLKNIHVREVGSFVCDNFNNIQNTFNEGFVVNNGNLYTINTTLKFSNEQNCKKISDLNVTNIVDSYFIVDNSKVYTFDNDTIDLKEYESNGRIPTYLMSNNIIMSYKYSSGNEYNYYVLKNDGKIYNISFKRDYHFEKGVGTYTYDVISESIHHEYPNEIIKSFTVSNNEITSITTNKGVYEKSITNLECTQYADVDCTYSLQKNEYFVESIDNVSYVNVNDHITYITKENKIFTVN